VAVGIGTALFDDPRLTARIEGVARQPRRVVFDSEARLPLESQLVRGVAEVPVTVVCSRAAARTSVQALEAAGVDVIVATGAGAFLEADEIDEARIFVAPLLTGGREAKTAVEGIGIEKIAAAPRALHVEVDRLEDDVLIVARLKEW
jgi:diaminohydroxyphosphoribosylaminopyrimidine deaminase/5-amino-6-(5-phosphoribosylamino)uracil reductase